MPRYEVVHVERDRHITQLLFYLIGATFFGISLQRFLISQTTSTTINLMISFSVVVYVVGRLYGELQVKKDFVEISSETVKFRSTPPFGNGWLPKTKEFSFDEIGKIDIIEIEPFYDPNNTRLSLALYTKNNKAYYFGNNLQEEQIIKIGLTLKGTVTLSRTLSSFLGTTTDEVGDQIKDIINVGKSLWNAFQKRGKGE